ncbi:MAG TPA: succinate dehydrogenase iron-sulfur subunit [Chloroflexia bacterium]|nr:succinate dehydrogenase iron-sulfur subunit [Chloroflexia bacterium]
MTQTMDGARDTNTARRSDVRVRILRQDKPTGDPSANRRWEEFDIPWQPSLNIISVLMYIQRNPVTVEGKTTDAVVWESNCLEEVCGACTMLINGKVRQACSALVDKLAQPITVEPLTSFPVVRDLIVDRSKIFEAFKQVRAWVPIDGTYDLGPGPKMNEEDRQIAYVLSTCMACTACMEACPNVNDDSPFIGPAAINQARLHNSHPTGQMHAAERLEALMAEGGIAYCGNDQNCVRVCPKGIPLTESIAEMNRQVNLYALKTIFKK